MDVITQHVNAARARRVGGILVGKRRNPSVAVEAAIPAHRVQEHQGEIAFLPDPIERDEALLVGRRPRRNHVLVAAVVALGVAGVGVAGYWIGRDRAPVRFGAASAELRTRLGAEQDRARELGERLANAKRLRDPNLLRTGQTILIPLP